MTKVMLKVKLLRLGNPGKYDTVELHPDTHEWEIREGHGLKWRLADGKIWYFFPLHRIWEIEYFTLNDSGNIVVPSRTK